MGKKERGGEEGKGRIEGERKGKGRREEGEGKKGRETAYYLFSGYYLWRTENFP